MVSFCASLLYSCSSNSNQIFFANLLVNYLTENRAVRELFKYCFYFVCKVFDRVPLDGFFLCITIVLVLFKCLSYIFLRIFFVKYLIADRHRDLLELFILF